VNAPLTAEQMNEASETEVARDMAIREIYAAADRLFEVMPPAFAHHFATEARDDADRKFRMRSRHNV
jgi:hypothetical protein